MLMNVTPSSNAIEIDIRNIDTVEELMKKLNVKEFFPNTFVIYEGSTEEILSLIRMLSFQQLKCIKSFKLNEFTMVYNPHQLDNRIIVFDEREYKSVDQALREMESSKYEPKRLIKSGDEKLDSVIDLINEHGGYLTLDQLYFKLKANKK